MTVFMLSCMTEKERGRCSMRYSDLHTHTVFSDGIHTMEDMVRAAAEQGFTSVGISDHSYTPFDLRYCIRQERLPEYHAELRRLKDAYAGCIEIYAGLEYDGYSQLEDRHLYDYLIGDCHYIKVGDRYFSVDHAAEEQRKTVDEWFGGDALAYCRAYFDTFVESTRLHRPDVLGHFDLPVKFGLVDEEDLTYRCMAAEALLACLEVTPIVELNTGAMARGLRGSPYPHRFLLREILQHGGRMILSSDAHRRENLGFRFDDGLVLLRETGFRSVAVLHRGVFEDVGIEG